MNDTGKEILKYAVTQEECVLLFKERDNGEMNVMDVTDHFRSMERLIEENDLKNAERNE